MRKITVSILVLIIIGLFSGAGVAEVTAPEKIKKPLQLIWDAINDLQTQVSDLLGLHESDVDDLRFEIESLKIRVAILEGQPGTCTDGETRECGSDVGECEKGTESCIGGVWSGACVNEIPPASEICDGFDNDCDSSTDEGLTITFYEDADKDSYGNNAASTEACTVPNGYVEDNTDCDDVKAGVNPGATETCNLIDDNCDGDIDEGCPPPECTSDAECVDGIPCTQDICQFGECTNTITQSSCLIEGDCFIDGDPNPDNPCQVCSADINPEDWTALNGTTCLGGICNSGVCTPTP